MDDKDQIMLQFISNTMAAQSLFAMALALLLKPMRGGRDDETVKKLQKGLTKLVAEYAQAAEGINGLIEDGDSE